MLIPYPNAVFRKVVPRIFIYLLRNYLIKEKSILKNGLGLQALGECFVQKEDFSYEKNGTPKNAKNKSDIRSTN